MAVGKITKGIAGFYYVFEETEGRLYECKAKGIFRKQKIKPLVGDNVEFEIVDEAESKGNIFDILPRKNFLIRPAVSNVDQAFVIFSVVQPVPNRSLLDRFLIQMDREKIPAVLCFTKKDLATEAEIQETAAPYEKSGCTVMFTSAKRKEGIQEVLEKLQGKTTVVAGPSGVGKSSLINLLQTDVNMETGVISKKIERGKHTTRHSQLIPVNPGAFIMDTPGFTSFSLQDMEKEELRFCFPEIKDLEGECRFQGCVHIKEPDCAVKRAVEEKRIHESRYKSYLEIYEELKDKKKY